MGAGGGIFEIGWVVCTGGMMALRRFELGSAWLDQGLEWQR